MATPNAMEALGNLTSLILGRNKAILHTIGASEAHIAALDVYDGIENIHERG
jgi:hypothetical protein